MRTGQKIRTTTPPAPSTVTDSNTMELAQGTTDKSRSVIKSTLIKLIPAFVINLWQKITAIRLRKVDRVETPTPQISLTAPPLEQESAQPSPSKKIPRQEIPQKLMAEAREILTSRGYEADEALQMVEQWKLETAPETFSLVVNETPYKQQDDRDIFEIICRRLIQKKGYPPHEASQMAHKLMSQGPEKSSAFKLSDETPYTPLKKRQLETVVNLINVSIEHLVARGFSQEEANCAVLEKAKDCEFDVSELQSWPFDLKQLQKPKRLDNVQHLQERYVRQIFQQWMEAEILAMEEGQLSTLDRESIIYQVADLHLNDIPCDLALMTSMFRVGLSHNFVRPKDPNQLTEEAALKILGFDGDGDPPHLWRYVEPIETRHGICTRTNIFMTPMIHSGFSLKRYKEPMNF